MDLSVNIAGVMLNSPIISSSGVDGRNGERICTAAAFKLGAATTKTIVKNMQPDVLPNMKMVRGGSMINCVFGANITAEQWFKQEFPKALEAGIPIIANMAGTTPEEAVELAKACEAAGASFIEYPTACPHMAGVLEVMYPGLKVALPEVHDPSDYARQIEAVKKAVNIPVIAKFSAIFHLHAADWARAAAAAGADAISAAAQGLWRAHRRGHQTPDFAHGAGDYRSGGHPGHRHWGRGQRRRRRGVHHGGCQRRNAGLGPQPERI